MRKPKSKTKSNKDFKSRGRSRKLDSNVSTDKQLPVRDINNDIKLDSNDPAWYMHNDSLAQAAGSIPFSYALGNQLYGPENKAYTMPGIVKMEVVPAFGHAMNMNDPINIAAVKIYTYVRHQNSGHANYDHTDLMMYILALGQAYSAHEWMKRIYGYLNTYSVMNRYIPRGYAKVDNINFDDFIDHLADLRYYINETAVKLSAFAIPQNFDLFKRHRFMYSNIHTDSSSSRAAMYMFTPAGFYRFDNTTENTGTSLQWMAWPHSGTPKTFAELVSYNNSLLDMVFGDEDTGIMSGDILKAYGNEAIYNPGAIDYDYSVMPVYDEAVLNQIHNATIYNIVAKPVSQTGTGIIQNQQLTAINTNYPKVDTAKVFLDTHLDNPTPSDILEMTRLVARKASIAGNDNYMSVFGGSELISYTAVYTWNASRTNFDGIGLNGYAARVADSIDYQKLTWISDVLSKFNEHPLQVYVDTNNSDKLMVLGDLDNVTTIDYIQLDNLHTTALLSLFGV